MTHPQNKAPLYPKGHLLAASGIAALLSFALLIFPSAEVEAKKTFIGLKAELSNRKAIDAPSADLSLSDYTAGKTSPFSGGFEDVGSGDPIQADQRNDNPLGLTQPIALDSGLVSIKAVSGDTLSKLFEKAGLPMTVVDTVLKSSKEARKFENIKPGQVIEFKRAPSGDLIELRTKLNDLEMLSVKRTEKGFTFKHEVVNPEIRKKTAYGSIENSLFADAKKAGLNETLAGQMAKLFEYDIDFAKDIEKGDTFKLIYEEIVVAGRTVRTGNILAARFVNQGKTYTAIRFTNKQGAAEYYNEKGEILRKAFLRTPVDFARISSRFSNGRRHPILNKIRAHQGVDYAAPRGTPIRAAGDGLAIFVGRKGGYGNTVILQHGNSYQTLYAHMQGFRKGMRKGSRVKQGDTIGFIGTTGLSTGPHLHYEFQIKGRHVDPLGQKQLMAEPIAVADKANFMKQSKILIATLDQEKASFLAMKNL